MIDPYSIPRLMRAIAIAIGVIFPLFFTVSGQVYNRPAEPLYDSGGALAVVPLPVSLLVCAAGVLLLSRFRDARPAILYAGAFLLAMMATTLIAGGLGPRKLILLAQFITPLIGLLLGMMLDEAEQLARTWLVLIVVFVLVQLAVPICIYGVNVLHHDMVIFSIYQHRQFVPVVFVAAFLVSAYSLWGRWPKFVGYASALMGFYAVMSVSMLTMGLFALGIGVLAWRVRARLPVWLGMLGMALGLALNGAQLDAAQKFAIFYQVDISGTSLRVPINVQRRIQDWHLYSAGIVDSSSSFFLGHAEPMSREVSTSAHNYYLDLAYNFGAVALLPIFALLAYTLRLLWNNRDRLRGDLALLGLALTVLFLLALDNNMKVSLRQPYPGVFTFFLWGWLLSRLVRTGPELSPHPLERDDCRSIPYSSRSYS